MSALMNCAATTTLIAIVKPETPAIYTCLLPTDGCSDIRMTNAQPDIAAWNTFSTVVVSNSYRSPFITLSPFPCGDLSAEYQELGDALVELRESDDEEWAIDESVYTMASFVAANLMSSAQPAPKVFNHGAKSVVFTWVNGDRNTYLTVSAEYVSALVSSSERIELRRDVPVSRLLEASQVFLSAIVSAQIMNPVIGMDGRIDLVHQTMLR